MGENALLDILVAAEAGDGRRPATPDRGLFSEGVRLDGAEQALFGEGERFDAYFAAMTDVPADSPLAPRAARLRLMRKHRVALAKALDRENPFSAALFSALAAGPGPTLAKRHFDASRKDYTDIRAVSALRRALSENVFSVYAEERDWLKRVGPKRSAANPTFFEKCVEKARGSGSIGFILGIVGVCVVMSLLSGVLIVPGLLPVAALVWLLKRAR